MKLLTLDDLLAFCEKGSLTSFSASEAGGPIVLQSFGEIVSDEVQDGLVKCKLKACHTELNRNKSFIADDVMSNALATFANRPILAYIHQLDDGSWDFYDHRMEIVGEGEDAKVNYLERPVGVVPESCNAHLEYDEENEKNYVCVDGLLYADYGNQTVDILTNKGGSASVSVELAVNQMAYNAKDKYVEIQDFCFLGVTLLGSEPDGTEVRPGMEGSELTLENFSADENSNFKDFNEGEHVMENETTVVVATEEPATEPVVETTVEPVVETYKKKRIVNNDNGITVEFDLSHDEIRSALYHLLAQYEEADNEWYFINAVYDDYMIYSNWDETKYFRHTYTVNGDDIALGDRIQVYNMFLTAEEKAVVDEARANYAETKANYEAIKAKYDELVEFKANYDAAVLRAQKDAVVAKAEYDCIRESKEFTELVNHIDEFTVEEIGTKADLIFAAHMKENMQFAAHDEPAQSSVIMVGMPKETRKSAYGNLFN